MMISVALLLTCSACVRPTISGKKEKNDDKPGSAQVQPGDDPLGSHDPQTLGSDTGVPAPGDTQSGSEGPGDPLGADTTVPPRNGDTQLPSGPSGPCFETQVMPIISAKCVGCHATMVPGLVLTGTPGTDYDALFAKLNLGDPSESLLLKKGHGDVPHGGGVKLSDAEYDLFVSWVTAGASDICVEPGGDATAPTSDVVDPTLPVPDTTPPVSDVVDPPVDPNLPCFSSQVMPVLQAKCLGCHASMVPNFPLTGNGAADYSAIIAKVDTTTPSESLLLKKGHGEIAHFGKNALTEAEYTLLSTWIAAGAPESCGVSTTDASTPPSDDAVTPTPDVQPPACGTCHGIPPKTGVHATHTNPETYNFDCTTCHNFPSEHMSGKVDIDFSASDPPNPQATYQNLTCSGVYCHGNGRTSTQTGTVKWNADTKLNCTGCHTSSLSGRHSYHKSEGVTCKECHDTVKDPTTIIDFSRHVDGKKDYTGPVKRTSAGCTGNCHGESHKNKSW